MEYTYFIGKVVNRDIQGVFFDHLINSIHNKKEFVTHKDTNNNSTKFLFYTPNALCKMRAKTFSNKEPEILEWIDKFGDNKPFWDIGSNIGLYSIYFAKKHKGKVYSFEPSFFNLKQSKSAIQCNFPLSNSQYSVISI